MTHVVVTVEVDPKTHIDLALPLNIPQLVLADAIAQALGVDKTGNQHYGLVVKTEKGMLRIPNQSTLGDVGVLDGSKLQLFHEKDAQASRMINSRAYLNAADTGQIFSLDSDIVLIGRKDLKHGVLVDIDLTSLDPHKIVSRKHAHLVYQEGKWFLIDQGSANGTWLNAHQISTHQSYPLQNGDEIIFGRKGVLMKFKLGG